MSSTVMTVFGQATDGHFERIVLAAAGTGEQFGSLSLTNHHRAVFGTPASNTGVVWIARTKAASESGNLRFELGPGEALVFSVKDINVYWFNPATTSDVIQVAVERANV